MTSSRGDVIAVVAAVVGPGQRKQRAYVGTGDGVSLSPADQGVWGSVVSSHSGFLGGSRSKNDLAAF